MRRGEEKGRVCVCVEGGGGVKRLTEKVTGGGGVEWCIKK